MKIDLTSFSEKGRGCLLEQGPLLEQGMFIRINVVFDLNFILMKKAVKAYVDIHNISLENDPKI